MQQVWLVGAGLLKMIYYVHCNSSEAFGISNDDFERCHGLFAFLDVLRLSSFLKAFVVILLDGGGLGSVMDDSRQARHILDAHGNAVADSLIHGVSVNDLAKHMYCLVDRSTCKAHIGSVRESVTKIFCKAISHECTQYFLGFACFSRAAVRKRISYYLFGELIHDLQFRTNTSLCSVSFVAKADDITTLADKARSFIEFLNSADEYTSRLAKREFIL